MKSTLRNMTLSLGLIAVAVAAMLAGVNLLTREPIAKAARQAAVDAVAAVLPPFDNDPLANPVEVDGCTLYAATLGGKYVATAVRVVTPDGFSGPITIMVGFDAAGTVTGYSILEHAETPGLGAKAPEWFRDTVGHRSVIGLAGPLALTKDGGEIDGITAATITSRAFIGAINRARAAYLKSLSI